MTVPLHPSESPFTVAEVRDRASPTGTYIYLWKTLGFGGKTFPNVYGRAASFACRSGTALMTPDVTRCQLYVDDPVISACGPLELAERELSLPLMWWLVLGPILAWSKGSFGTGSHVWIGVKYTPGPYITMELPPDYLRSTLETIEPLCAYAGNVALGTCRSAVGKAARIAYIAPDATPFVSQLWGALAGGLRAAELALPGTSRNQLPARRFMAAARWLSRLIAEALAKHNRSGGSWILKCRIEDRLPLSPRGSFLATPPLGEVAAYSGSAPLR